MYESTFIVWTVYVYIQYRQSAQIPVEEASMASFLRLKLRKPQAYQSIHCFLQMYL